MKGTSRFAIFNEHIITWRHFPTFRIAGPLNPPTTGEFPSQKGSLMGRFDDFVVIGLNKLSNKHSSCRWFQTPCRAPVWRYCSAAFIRREKFSLVLETRIRSFFRMVLICTQTHIAHIKIWTFLRDMAVKNQSLRQNTHKKHSCLRSCLTSVKTWLFQT